MNLCSVVSEYCLIALCDGPLFEGCPANIFALAVAVDTYHNVQSSQLRVRDQIRDSLRRARMSICS